MDDAERIFGTKLADIRLDNPFFDLIGDREVADARDKVKAWCESYEYGCTGYFLASAKAGRCKTALLASTYNFLNTQFSENRRGETVSCTNMSRLMYLARNDNSSYEKVKYSSVLLFDDIGIENFSGYKGDDMNAELYSLINDRYNRNLTTCFTSNFGITELLDKKHVLEQTVDRIRGMTAGGCFEIKGTSIRERSDLRQLEAESYRILRQREEDEKRKRREAIEAQAKANERTPEQYAAAMAAIRARIERERQKNKESAT